MVEESNAILTVCQIYKDQNSRLMQLVCLCGFGAILGLLYSVIGVILVADWYNMVANGSGRDD